MREISKIINKIKPDKRLKILSHSCHERAQVSQSKINADFYLYHNQQLKRWESKYAPLPSNFTILPDNYIPSHVDFDLVLFQNIAGAAQTLIPIAQRFNLPIVRYEHTTCDGWPLQQRMQCKQFSGDMNIFISEYSRKQWLFDDMPSSVLEHGIETEVFNFRDLPRENYVLSVVNDFVNRNRECGYNLWENVTYQLPRKLLGATPGLSEPAKSVDDLVENLNKCQVFLNTSIISPIPMALLEAMSCGAIVVSTATCAIPEYIEDGVNGFCSNDASTLRQRIMEILKEPEKYKELGEKARQTILEKCSIEKYSENFEKILRSVI